MGYPANLKGTIYVGYDMELVPSRIVPATLTGDGATINLTGTVNYAYDGVIDNRLGIPYSALSRDHLYRHHPGGRGQDRSRRWQRPAYVRVHNDPHPDDGQDRPRANEPDQGRQRQQPGGHALQTRRGQSRRRPTGRLP